MSCFFCDSIAHLSQNCDVHVSNEFRQKIAETKNCCNRCFTDLSNNYHFSKICRKNRKCYNCFSKDHHTFLCRSENLLDSTIFIPNIDVDLIPRFLILINSQEQNLLTLLSPKTAKFIKPKQITVVEENNIHKNNANLLITHTLKLFGGDYVLPTASTIFIGDSIYMKSLLSQKFLQYLSPRLKYLHCEHVTLVHSINFMQIFQAAPNLEVIILDDINVNVNNSWPEEIIQWKNGNYLAKLTISINDFDFNVESLVTVIKEKCKKNAIISINMFAINIFPVNPKSNILENIEKKMMPYFYHVDGISDVRGGVEIFVATLRNSIHRCYSLKEEF